MFLLSLCANNSPFSKDGPIRGVVSHQGGLSSSIQLFLQRKFNPTEEMEMVVKEGRLCIRVVGKVGFYRVTAKLT